MLTLLAVAAAGVLVWVATRFDLDENTGFWAAMGMLALGGVALGLAQIGRGDGDPAAMTLAALLPAGLATAWVLLATQPGSNELGDRVSGWSDDVGIDGLVSSLGTFGGVLAFGTGVVLGLTFAEALSRARALDEQHVHGRAPAYAVEDADEPTAAERRAAEAEAQAEAAEREAERARREADEERRAARR